MAVEQRRTTGPFAIKDHRQLIADTEAGAEGSLKRAVGALDLTALGIGAVIGTGIFVVIGEGVKEAGPAVILSYEFLENTFDYTLPASISTAREDGGVLNLPAVLIVFAVMFVLARGVRETAKANLVMVGVKLLVLAFFIVVAFSAAFNADNLSPFSPQGTDGIVSAAAIIFFAYIGFDAVSTGAEEARQPKRDLPLAIVGSLLICTIIYILVAVAATGSTDATQLAESDAPLATALDEGAGISWAASVMAFGALVAITSVLLTIFYGQTRIFFAMARDGLLPRGIAKVNPRTGTPVGLTFGMGIAIAALAAVAPLSEIVKLVNIGTLSAFFLVNVGVVILRHTQPDIERPFKVPLANPRFPLFPVIGCLLIIYLVTTLPGESWLRFVGWLVLGLLIYVFYGRRHSVLQREATSRERP